MAANTKGKSLAEIAEALGYDPKLARLLPVEVKVEPLDAPVSDALLARLAEQGIEEAAAPITESGKPRMLKLTAWIAHGGPANRNRDAFLNEDLEELARDGLFVPPYLGMVDFNHDFTPYGAWYKASYEFDPIADEYGLLAEGTLFAWRFEELADKVLAEQVRSGSMAVSMACIARAIETRTGPDGLQESVLRKPVFLTASLLDVPPGDANARGVGSESEESTPDDRRRELNKAFLDIHAAEAGTFDIWLRAAQAQLDPSDGTTQEVTEMDIEQIVAKLTEALGDKAQGLIEELKSAVADAAKVPGLETKVAELTEQMEALTVERDAAVAQNDTLAGELEAAKTSLEAKVAELAGLTEEHEALVAERDAALAEQEEARLAALREERIAALPESYRTALEAREEDAREKVIARLVEMSEDDFAEELALLQASFPGKASYTERSGAEGVLSGHAGAPAGGYAIDKFVD